MWEEEEVSTSNGITERHSSALFKKNKIKEF
jgi:hypothetical protein